MQMQSSAAERAGRTVERARNAAAVLETYEHGPQNAFSAAATRRSVSFDMGDSGGYMPGWNARWEQPSAQPSDADIDRQAVKGRSGMLPSLTKSHSLSSLEGDGDVEHELESVLNSFANMGTEQHRRFVDHRLRKAQGNDNDWDQGVFFAPGARVVVCGQDNSGVLQIYNGREGVVISEDGRDRYLVQLAGASELCQLSLRAENLQQVAEEQHDVEMHYDPARQHIQPARDFEDIHKLATLHAEQSAKREVQRLYQEADEQKRRIEQTARAEAFFRTDLMTKDINQLFRERCSYGKKCGRPGCKFLHPWDAAWAGRTVGGSDSKAMYKISRGIYEKHTPTIGGNRGKGGQKVQKRSKSQTDNHSPRRSPRKPIAGTSFPRSMADVQKNFSTGEDAARITPFELSGDGCLAEEERPRVLPSAGSIVAEEVERFGAGSRNEATALADGRIQRGARRVVLAELSAQPDSNQPAAFEEERRDPAGEEDEEARRERIRRLAEQKKLQLRQRKERVPAHDLDTAFYGEEVSKPPVADGYAASPKHAQLRNDHDAMESAFDEAAETTASPGSEQRSAQDTESGVPSPQQGRDRKSVV